MTSSLSFENTFDLLQQALEETEVAVAGADDGGNGQRIGERENGRVPRGWTLKHSCHTQANRRDECAGGKTCKHRRCCEQTHLDVMPHGENNGQRRGVASWVTVVRARRVLRAGPTLRPVASLPRNQALAAPFARHRRGTSLVGGSEQVLRVAYCDVIADKVERPACCPEHGRSVVVVCRRV